MTSSRLASVLLALVCAAMATTPAAAAGATSEKKLTPSAGERPLISANKFEQISEGEMLLTGDVDLRYGELRLLADKVHFNDTTHMVQAEGNVVMMVDKSQISGDRLEMNVETKQATVWNAHGYMDPDVVFQAEKVERIADDKVIITDGTITTCTQPTPYWAFHVTSALLHLDHYAHMRNVAFKVEKVPLIYLPYLVWPMKKDRATGLLLPNVGYSKQRGSFIGNALYVVMGRSQDVTLFYDLYGRSGTGLGYEYRFVPAAHGDGSFTGYYLHDSAPDPNNPGQELSRTRYRFKFQETQRFGDGFRFLADLNKVSDLDYYRDFERDITQTTSPTVFSHIDLVRNWENYSLNVRADQQEQFISTTENLTLRRLPEIELRGRGIRFGHTPFYLSFETSAGVYNKERQFNDDPIVGVFTREMTYNRMDLFPTISASFTPAPWLDISPSVSARETFYSRSLFNASDPNNFELTSGKDITREFGAFNLSLIGPRLFRIYGDPRRSDVTVYKHTFEPHLVYSYIPDVSDGENVIRFDDVDTLRLSENQVTYSLTSRLFARRPVQQAPPPKPAQPEPLASDVTGPTQVSAPVTDVKDLPEPLKQVLQQDTQRPGVGAVEMATFDLSQAYSFDSRRPLSIAAPVEPDGTLGTPSASHLGPVVASLRYNPTAAASLDVRTSYDILYDDIRSVSLSADLRSLKYGYARVSWFLNRDFDGQIFDSDPTDPNNPLSRRTLDSSQIRLIGGSSFLRRKVTLDLEGSYDIQNHDLLDQRYRLGYNTQCCGVLVEVARRNFQTLDEIQYRFTLNLRGVGTFLDLQGRPR